MVNYIKHPKNVLEMCKELKRCIDGYWSAQVTEGDLKEVILHYATNYPNRLFMQGNEETEGYTKTAHQRLGKRRLELINKMISGIQIKF